jgi:S1-C subfamily serine protease
MIADNAVFERRSVEARAAEAAQPPFAVRKAPTASTPVAAGGFARAAVAPTPMGMPSGVLGAAMTNVDPDLANSLVGMKGKRGVLVTQVPDGSIAARSGLRAGDVILKVESSEVSTVPEFRVRLGMAEQNGTERVRITILRGGKTQELYYTPPR